MSPMSARRARRMRSACSAFSTDIAIQRAGKARDGRQTRVVAAGARRQRIGERLGLRELEVHEDLRPAAASPRSTA